MSAPRMSEDRGYPRSVPSIAARQRRVPSSRNGQLETRLLGAAAGLPRAGLARAQRFGKPPPDLAPRLNWWVTQHRPAGARAGSSFRACRWMRTCGSCRWRCGWCSSAAGRSSHSSARLGWSRRSHRRRGARRPASATPRSSAFPLIEMLRHKEALPFAALADQLGCSIALAVGGITIAAIYGGGKPEPRVIVRRVLLFPPFLALVDRRDHRRVRRLARRWSQAEGWRSIARASWPASAPRLTPVALFSIGLNFKLRIGSANGSARRASRSAGSSRSRPPSCSRSGSLVGAQGIGARRRRASGGHGDRWRPCRFSVSSTAWKPKSPTPHWARGS